MKYSYQYVLALIVVLIIMLTGFLYYNKQYPLKNGAFRPTIMDRSITSGESLSKKTKAVKDMISNLDRILKNGHAILAYSCTNSTESLDPPIRLVNGTRNAISNMVHSLELLRHDLLQKPISDSNVLSIYHQLANSDRYLFNTAQTLERVSEEFNEICEQYSPDHQRKNRETPCDMSIAIRRLVQSTHYLGAILGLE